VYTTNRTGSLEPREPGTGAYPSQTRPPLVQRSHDGVASSHFTRLRLFAVLGKVFTRLPFRFEMERFASYLHVMHPVLTLFFPIRIILLCFLIVSVSEHEAQSFQTQSL
jgi:hypothetical protein